MNISDEAVEVGAASLVREQTQGLCEFQKVCAVCDCFPRDRDAYALAHARRVLEAAAPYLMGTAFVRGYQSALADRSQGRSRRTPKWSRKQNPAGAGE